ncbi:MAG: hypothetical protein ACI4MS_08270 [Candidatus Coproplasma sp.]
MKKYRIVYWNNGNKRVFELEAENLLQARVVFEMYCPNDDIIEIKEKQDE